MTKGNKKTCIRLLNDLSIAFYNDDTKLRQVTYYWIEFYEFMFATSGVVTEIMLIVNNYKKS